MPQKLFPQRILKLYIRIMQIMSPLYGELILIIRIPNETNKISSENYQHLLISQLMIQNIGDRRPAGRFLLLICQITYIIFQLSLLKLPRNPNSSLHFRLHNSSSFAKFRSSEQTLAALAISTPMRSSKILRLSSAGRRMKHGGGIKPSFSRRSIKRG